MKKINKPKLRFKEFKDEWRQTKLNEITDVKDGTHESPKYVENGYPLVTSKNLLDNGLDMSNVSYISLKDFESINKRSKVDKGDIIFGMIGTIGKPNIIYNNDFAIKNVALIKNNSNISNYFILNLLKSNVFDKYIYSNNAGGTQKFISLNLIRDFAFKCASVKEQRQIGLFFNKIDDLIELKGNKISSLERLKRGYLQKLFTDPYENKSKLRFKGFNDDWQKNKIGKIMNVSSSKRVHMEEWTNKGVPFFRARDLIAVKNNKAITDPLFISEDTYKEYSNISGVPIKNDLLVTGVGTIGVPFLVKDDKKFYFKDGNVIWFHNDNVINGSFLFYAFNTETIQDDIKAFSGIGTVATYTIQSGRKTILNYPSVEEQRKIGKIMALIDKQINLQQKELYRLKSLKKGYLQKMFI